jgi:photosystem II stability/assembly factor-like uncharacterized protein
MYCAVVRDITGTTTYLYKSTDAGTNWIAMANAPFSDWTRIQCNYDGTIVLAAQANGSLYLSEDGGDSWTAQTTGGSPIRWGAVYLSDNGRVLVGGQSDGGFLWVSVDGGTNWTLRGTSRRWTHISGSSDGSLICASATAFPATASLYTSTDFGTTWTGSAIATNLAVYQTATSINGNKFAFVAESYPALYITQDGGAYWESPSDPAAGFRYGIAITPDGTKLILGGNSTGSLRPETAVGT